MIVYRRKPGKVISSVLPSYQTEWNLLALPPSSAAARGLGMLTTVIARLSRGHLATQRTFGPSIEEDIYCSPNCRRATFEDADAIWKSEISLCHTSVIKCPFRRRLFFFFSSSQQLSHEQISEHLDIFKVISNYRQVQGFKFNVQTVFKKCSERNKQILLKIESKSYYSLKAHTLNSAGFIKVFKTSIYFIYTYVCGICILWIPIYTDYLKYIKVERWGWILT